MHYRESYSERLRNSEWFNDSRVDKRLLQELKSISDEKDIEDRFYKDLEFGTAGIRGVLGAGTNRMNVHTVSRVAEALSMEIKRTNNEHRGVVIGYDVRHMSKEFAELSAEILSNNGIKVYLFDDIVPTPVLSYAIRKLRTVSGVMITASHNPKEYNGYKVYWDDATQIGKETADNIVKHMNNIEDMFGIERLNLNEALDLGIVEYVDNKILSDYKNEVLNLSINNDVSNISVVYSPLHGTGNKFIKDIFKKKGFNLHIVEEQSNADPDFTTVESPNPEEIEAFDYSVKLAKEVNADLIITTDPDADRVGVMVKHDGEYKLVTGNQLGTLVTHYILKSLHEKGQLKRQSKIIKTIVTDNLVDKIAKDFNVEVVNVHVGFKNIYSKVNEWEKNDEEDNYILGYEESLGFGIGHNLARDKDATSASLIIAEMVSEYLKEDKTIIDVLNEIQEEYGFHNEHLESIVMPGKDGQRNMQRLVKAFRENPIEKLNGHKLVRKIDYLHDETDLEKLNVIKCEYEDGTWFVIRPSGTEPKLKLYIYTVGNSHESTESKMKSVIKELKDTLK